MMTRMADIFNDLWGENVIKHPTAGLVLGHLEATASIEEFRLFVALGTFRSAQMRATTPVGVLYVRATTT